MKIHALLNLFSSALNGYCAIAHNSTINAIIGTANFVAVVVVILTLKEAKS